MYDYQCGGGCDPSVGSNTNTKGMSSLQRFCNLASKNSVSKISDMSGYIFCGGTYSPHQLKVKKGNSGWSLLKSSKTSVLSGH